MTSRMTEDDYNNFTASQLRSHLKKRKLGTNGKKGELVSRLLESDKKKKDMSKSVVPKQAGPRKRSSGSSPSENKNVNGSGLSKKKIEERKEMERREREKIVLWRSPLTTLRFFVMEAGVLLYSLGGKLYARKKAVLACALITAILLLVYHLEGSHQVGVTWLRKYILWSAYWVGLGILSSVGLGTGLHTFLLYLGPHIAKVTLAAYECESVAFPEPPYPNEIICPEDEASVSISMWTIISKVRLEAFMWGAGTALGELPPYFMARAARMSGTDLDDDEFEEIEELIQEKNTHPDDMSFMEKAKLSVHNLVQRVGFFGILLCASIPNPLFDLAGITCGHFLVPFWTFFGATLIGKAIIKMHIQKLFVIFLFSQHHVETLVSVIGQLPKYGPTLQTPFKDYLAAQKEKLHKGGSSTGGESSNVLAWVFEKLVMVMVAYFLLSIINSMAQSYHKRQCAKRRLQNR